MSIHSQARQPSTRPTDAIAIEAIATHPNGPLKAQITIVAA